MVIENDGGDHAGGDCGQDVLAIGFTPFIALGRPAQVVVAIVERLGAAPIAVAHPFASTPMVAVAAVFLAPAGMLLACAAIAVIAAIAIVMSVLG